ncbi:MAG: signal peptidase I [Alphaproteobacteria bacterium]|jgi:conjugal transfer pilin signal peptidase TrbI|nr:signal peptidase I [Alphaproteobacteria bacterium]MBT5389490.1 signal peptidase I [Alphaproteobacteria bacterium]MBT5654361.1 signal peptidase I [Alphaproteobacteria bacterium]
MKYLFFAGTSSCFLFVLITCTYISFNCSESLGSNVFFCIKYLPLKRGDLVGIEDHNTKYFLNTHFTKYLLGLPGDEIKNNDGKTFVAGKPIGAQKAHTKFGKPLTPLTLSKIPKGYVFVGTNHPDSFDSRYEEFGLVKQEHLQGKCFGLLRRSRV